MDTTDFPILPLGGKKGYGHRLPLLCLRGPYALALGLSLSSGIDPVEICEGCGALTVRILRMTKVLIRVGLRVGALTLWC